MKNDNQKNIVYILTNESMPGYIKIGFTSRKLEFRLRELDVTSTPLPFEVYYACEVEKSNDEKWLHAIFSDRRVRDNREFFKMDPERVVLALKRIQIKEIKLENEHGVDITPEQKKDITNKKIIRSKFDFKKYGIKIGAEIYFSRDESIRAKVLKNNKIELNGMERGLSESAQELLNYKKQPAGTLFWKYDGETLDERRRRIDEENLLNNKNNLWKKME